MKLCCGTNLYASFSLEEALEEIKKTVHKPDVKEFQIG